jgi:hypothetical protein
LRGSRGEGVFTEHGSRRKIFYRAWNFSKKILHSMELFKKIFTEHGNFLADDDAETSFPRRPFCREAAF